MSPRTPQTLLSIVLLIALVIPPAAAGAAPAEWIDPADARRQVDPTRPGYLFRAVVEIRSDTDLARLRKTGVQELRIVTAGDSRTISLLVDGEQLATLARLGFRPVAADELRLLVSAQGPERRWFADSLEPFWEALSQGPSRDTLRSLVRELRQAFDRALSQG